MITRPGRREKPLYGRQRAFWRGGAWPDHRQHPEESPLARVARTALPCGHMDRDGQGEAAPSCHVAWLCGAFGKGGVAGVWLPGPCRGAPEEGASARGFTSIADQAKLRTCLRRGLLSRPSPAAEPDPGPRIRLAPDGRACLVAMLSRVMTGMGRALPSGCRRWRCKPAVVGVRVRLGLSEFGRPSGAGCGLYRYQSFRTLMVMFSVRRIISLSSFWWVASGSVSSLRNLRATLLQDTEIHAPYWLLEQ
jgi:hypothetical protein